MKIPVNFTGTNSTDNLNAELLTELHFKQILIIEQCLLKLLIKFFLKNWDFSFCASYNNSFPISKSIILIFYIYIYKIQLCYFMFNEFSFYGNKFSF